MHRQDDKDWKQSMHSCVVDDLSGIQGNGSNSSDTLSAALFAFWQDV